jgi:hypothetical protein
MSNIEFIIKTEFSYAPGPRYSTEGNWSGENLRKLLLPKIKEAIKNNGELKINLDGTAGYGTSFLEEVFGGLIREDGLEFDQINKHVEFISKEEPYLIEDINEYMTDAHEKTT